MFITDLFKKRIHSGTKQVPIFTLKSMNHSLNRFAQKLCFVIHKLNKCLSLGGSH